MTKYSKDKFISSILGYDVINIKDSKNIKLKKTKQNKILYCCNVEISKKNDISELIEKNFNLVSTNLTFEINKKNLISNKNKLNFRYANKKDMNEVAKIASDSFTTNRFSLDSEILNNESKKIKKIWAKNFFMGKRGDYMIVAKINNSVVGFILLLKKNNNIIIDLIAVNKNFRKKGYGEELIRSINSFTKINYNKILVGTELSNISAINLYLKIGFKLIFSTHSFHLHKYN